MVASTSYIKTGLISFVVSLVAVGIFFWPAIYRSYIKAPIQAQSVEAIAESKIALAEQSTSKNLLSGVPTHISLPSAGITLPVAPGGPTDETSSEWILSQDKVNYDVTRTTINNNKGASLLYGHNTKSVLANTANLEVGDPLIIRTKNSLVFKYKLVSIRSVLPTDLAAVNEAGPARVLLLTCEGSFNQLRRLMEFSLVKATEIT